MPVTILNMGYREQQRMRWLDGINGHELGQTLGDGEGPGSLVCCSPWGYRVGHDLVTEQQQIQQ